MSTYERTCPYCAEPILDAAQKCRYCGEWLTQPPSAPVEHARHGSGWSQRGTVEARAVSKGIKEKELDDFSLKVLTFVWLVAFLVLGGTIEEVFGPGVFWSAGIAFVATLPILLKITSWYFRE